MGRMKNGLEAQRELVEGDLGRLGNVLVYLRLIGERLQAAAHYNGNSSVLQPAVEDLQRAARLVRLVQINLITRKEQGNED